MAELEEIKVRLRVDDSDLDRAAGAAEQFGGGLAKSTSKANANLKELSQTATVAGAGLLAGFGLAAGAAANFEKELSGVAAVAGASSAEMDQLRDAALEAGKATVFSASEAAKAEAELAKAGISTADILGGALTGSLDLAAAGQLELADAATISAQAMKQFGLRGSDVTHIADVLAAGANKSAADVGQLADALRQGGLVAAQTGLSLEDTVGTLSAFADNALIGSDAGTSLKTTLQRLTPQSAEARDAMKSLGLNAFDASGQFIGMAKFAGQLQDSLGGLSTEQRNAALNTIFGADAIRSASILMKLGEEGVRDYVSAVDDQGAAARMAGVQLDNLSGDIEALKGSLETALIGTGSKATGVLRFMAQGATDAVNSFTELPGPVQAAAAGLTGVGGASLLALGAIGTLIPKVSAARAALDGMGVAGHRANVALGALGKATGVATVMVGIAVGIDAIFEALHRAQFGKVNLSSLGNSLVDLGKKGKVSGELAKQFGRDLDDLGVKALMANDKLEAAMKLGDLSGPLLSFSDDVTDAKRDIEALDQTLADLVRGGNADVAANGLRVLTDQLKSQGVETSALTGLLTGYKDALTEVDTQTKLAPESTSELAQAVEGLGEEAGEATNAIDLLETSLGRLIGVHLAAEQAAINFERAIDDAIDTIKENGRSLDINSEAGRRNREVLGNVVRTAQDHVLAMVDQGKTAEEIGGVLDHHRAQLEQVRVQTGLTAAQVASYNGQLDAIQTQVTTQITADTSRAEAALARLRQALSRIERDIITVPGGPISARAHGGPISAGEPYIVGEDGPELIIPRSAGHVLTAPETSRALGGPSINATFTINADGATPGVVPLIRAEVDEAFGELVRALTVGTGRHG